MGLEQAAGPILGCLSSHKPGVFLFLFPLHKRSRRRKRRQRKRRGEACAFWDGRQGKTRQCGVEQVWREGVGRFSSPSPQDLPSTRLPSAKIRMRPGETGKGCHWPRTWRGQASKEEDSFMRVITPPLSSSQPQLDPHGLQTWTAARIRLFPPIRTKERPTQNYATNHIAKKMHSLFIPF